LNETLQISLDKPVSTALALTFLVKRLILRLWGLQELDRNTAFVKSNPAYYGPHGATQFYLHLYSLYGLEFADVTLIRLRSRNIAHLDHSTLKTSPMKFPFTYFLTTSVCHPCAPVERRWRICSLPARTFSECCSTFAISSSRYPARTIARHDQGCCSRASKSDDPTNCSRLSLAPSLYCFLFKIQFNFSREHSKKTQAFLLATVRVGNLSVANDLTIIIPDCVQWQRWILTLARSMMTDYKFEPTHVARVNVM